MSEPRHYILRLPYLKPPLNANQRLHRMAEYRLQAQVKGDTIRMALMERLPTGLSRVQIVLHYRPASRRKRDTDNLSATLKPAIDGLKTYGLIPDDNSEHVLSTCVIDPVEPGQPGQLYLHIIDLTEEAA